MNIEPPVGSKITVDRDIHSTSYIWKNGEKNIGQYFTAAFMTFWLCGWTVGGFMAAKTLFTESDMPVFGRAFMLFWLCGWAVGETFVIFALYNTFKPIIPSKITLSSNSFEFETGTTPFNMSGYNSSYRSQGGWKFLKKLRNKVYRLDFNTPTNLKLEWAGECKRLTFDVGAERVEIGDSLSEPEKEWLHEILKNNFKE